MPKSIIKLMLDTSRENRVQEPIAVQKDYGSRFLEITFTTLGEFVPIPGTAEVTINATRKDGASKSFSGEVNADGTVQVPITQWMTELDDRVTYTVSAITDKKLSTTPSTFMVKPSPDTTDIPEEDTPEADLLAEVLANENARQAAEATRVSNETARKSAENARQSAETQRLTDEATRVANESARVSAESSRDATFKGWAQDIASLPSFDARISANADRITNLESGIPSSLWEVDDSTAYVKDVPTNARPRAIINKIGGMTYKSKNLFIPSKVNTTSIGITISYSNGYVKMSGTKTSGVNVITVQAQNITLPAGTYIVSCKMVSGSITSANNFDGVYFGINKDTYSLRTAPGVSAVGAVGKRVITLTEPTAISSFDITPGYSGSGTVFNDALFAFQFEAGDTATEYQDGYEGLRSAKVTAVKSVGRNLIPFPYTFGNSATHGGVTFSAGNNGSITVNGTSTGKAYCNLAIFTASNLLTGTYSAHTEPYNAVRMLIEAYNGTTWYKTLLQGDGTIEIDWNGYSEIRVMLYIFTGNSFSNVTVYPMLNKGSTAEPYAPYHSETLTIPAAVQALDGWGQGILGTDCYNFLDWRPEDGVRAWHHIKDRYIFDGTEVWKKGSGDYVFLAYAHILPSTPKNFGSVGNTHDYKLELSNNNIFVKTTMTADEFAAELATLYEAGTPFIVDYERNNPEVTDISDLLPADNLITVEGGGTLTFENEHGYDMPNTVTYMLKEVTA